MTDKRMLIVPAELAKTIKPELCVLLPESGDRDPVIVAGEAWIRNKGLTMDASTAEDAHTYAEPTEP